MCVELVHHGIVRTGVATMRKKSTRVGDGGLQHDIPILHPNLNNRTQIQMFKHRLVTRH